MVGKVVKNNFFDDDYDDYYDDRWDLHYGDCPMQGEYWCQDLLYADCYSSGGLPSGFSCGDADQVCCESYCVESNNCYDDEYRYPVDIEPMDTFCPQNEEFQCMTATTCLYYGGEFSTHECYEGKACCYMTETEAYDKYVYGEYDSFPMYAD